MLQATKRQFHERDKRGGVRAEKGEPRGMVWVLFSAKQPPNYATRFPPLYFRAVTLFAFPKASLSCIKQTITFNKIKL